ncbi:MAG: hypothetical protein ACLPX9_08550 [Rhodomicrobium sp.]
MFWNTKKSPLETEEEDWIFDCWQWLLRELGPLARLKRTPLVLPSDEFFPPTKAKGHARAEHLFNCVARLTGTSNWPYKLVPQEDAINPVLAPLAVVKDAPSDPARTFALRGGGGEIRITYKPDLISQPAKLIATLVHEIAHGLVLDARSRTPGEDEFEEYAVDLTTVFLGFGLFGANHAFEFRQFHDIGTGTQGWSWSRLGYLSETQWGFCLGVFLRLRDEPADTALHWLRPGPAAALKRTLRYLEKNPERMSGLY